MDATPPEEFMRRKDHWDHILSHVVLVSEAMRGTRTARLTSADQVSTNAQKHGQELRDAWDQRQRLEEQLKMVLAKRVMREVAKQWKLVTRVIRARRRKGEPDEEENPLSAFLKQGTHVSELSVASATVPASDAASRSRDGDASGTVDRQYDVRTEQQAIAPTLTSFVMSRSAIADMEIKELLVRRRLLATDTPDSVNLDAVGLLITSVDPPSLLSVHSTRRLNAAIQRPPADTRTTPGHKTLRAHQQRFDRAGDWKHKANINRSRCHKQFVYSAEVLRAAESIAKDSPSMASNDGCSSWTKVDAMHGAVESYQERRQSISRLITRFACVTAKAVATDAAQVCILQEFDSTGSDIRIEEHAEHADVVGLIDEYLLRVVQRDWEHFA